MSMIFDLQRFDGEGAEAVEGAAESAVDDVQIKIDAATAKLKSELETERKKREVEAKRDAERLSKLSDDERRKAELDDTRRELEQQKAEFEREKVKFEAAKVLGQRGLPIEFVDYVIGADNHETLQRITSLEKHYRKSVEAAVAERLKGKAPAASGDKASGARVNSSFMDAIFKNQIRR